MFAVFVTFLVFITILFGGLWIADKLEINDGWKLSFAIAVVVSLYLFLRYGESSCASQVQQWLDQQRVYRLRSVGEILDSLPEKEEKWGIK